MIGNRLFSRGATLDRGPRESRYNVSHKRFPRFSTRLKLLLAGLLVVGIGFIIYLFANPPVPPTLLLQAAKMSLDTSSKEGAIRYAEKSYRHAEELIKSGWMEMARQNGRLAPLRNYQKADSLLMAAIKAASDAGLEAKDFV